MGKIMKLFRSQGGAAVIEYALIAAIISVALIAGANAVGVELGTAFNTVSNAL